jgi:hypothetical protein
VFLRHALAVAEVLVRLECACRNNPLVRFVAPKEIARQRQSSTLGTQFQWHVTVRLAGFSESLGVIPDAVFALKYRARPPNRDATFFFLEADRGTMPVQRRNLQGTSFFQKMLAYYETWRQELHTKIFTASRFRVLTVTNTPERAQNIIVANRAFNDGKGSGLFLVTDVTALSAHEDILSLPLASGRNGELVNLADS